MDNDQPIPNTAVCSTCGFARGEHSAGSFYCPSPTSEGSLPRFTSAAFTL